MAIKITNNVNQDAVTRAKDEKILIGKRNDVLEAIQQDQAAVESATTVDDLKLILNSILQRQAQIINLM